MEKYLGSVLYELGQNFIDLWGIVMGSKCLWFNNGTQSRNPNVVPSDSSRESLRALEIYSNPTAFLDGFWFF